MKSTLGILLSGLLSTSAVAEPMNTWSVAVDWLAVSGERSSGDVRRRLEEIAVNEVAVALDNDRKGYHFKVGYEMAPHWTLQAGYMDLGAVDYGISLASRDFERAQSALKGIAPATGKGLTLGAQYRYPVMEHLAVEAGISAFSWKADDRQRLNGKVNTYKSDGIDILYGVGVSSDVLGVVDVGLAWQQVALDNETLQLWGIRLTSSF